MTHTEEPETMTITIELTHDEEIRLRERASDRGRDLKEYVHDLIIRDIRALPQADLDEALDPFRQQVEASGMTDDQLEEFFEGVRDEVWREKQGTLPGRDGS